MKQYTQNELDDLISCEKEIYDPPKQDMREERGSRRNNMGLRSLDGSREFSVFMRINEDFPENFSIGLEYHPQEERGSICLLRCNGPHGDFFRRSHSLIPFPLSHPQGEVRELVIGFKSGEGRRSCGDLRVLRSSLAPFSSGH